MSDETELWLARRQSDANPDFGLFAPAARTSDPVTSHMAEEAIRPRRGSQAMTLLQVYATAPGGLTDEEVAVQAKLGQGAWKRCSDLRRAGYIVPTGNLRPSSAGLLVQVCRITEAGKQRVAA
jgi:hypothetical protein